MIAATISQTSEASSPESASGGIRTHTIQVLNLSSLPVGIRRQTNYEPRVGIEPTTSFLPRKCSATELSGQTARPAEEPSPGVSGRTKCSMKDLNLQPFD